jgi:hypothetical protein
MDNTDSSSVLWPLYWAVKKWAKDRPTEFSDTSKELSYSLADNMSYSMLINIWNLPPILNPYIYRYLSSIGVIPPCLMDYEFAEEPRAAYPAFWTEDILALPSEMEPCEYARAMLKILLRLFDRHRTDGGSLLDYVPAYQRRETCVEVHFFISDFEWTVQMLKEHKCEHDIDPNLAMERCSFVSHLAMQRARGRNPIWGVEIEDMLREIVGSLKHSLLARQHEFPYPGQYSRIKTLGEATRKGLMKGNETRKLDCDRVKEAARKELLRRHLENPKLTKTSIIDSMSKVKIGEKARWGSYSTLMRKYCQDVNLPSE